jgi:UDP-N-acetyl-D-mannosaminuronate dehydrogenase
MREAMSDDFAESLRSAFLKNLRARSVVVRTPLHPANSYPLEQLRDACQLAYQLRRGDLILLEDPRDAV